jgi:hypothetical protein
MLHIFVIVFHVFLHVFQAHVSNVSVVSYVRYNCFRLDVSKVDRGCCACCNMSHLPQLSVVVASGAVHGGERRGRHGGSQEAGKRGEVSRAGPASRCWRRRPDARAPSGLPLPIPVMLTIHLVNYTQLRSCFIDLIERIILV